MNDWIEDAVQKIKENPQNTKVICADLWDAAYEIGTARQKCVDGDVEDFVSVRCVMKIIDKVSHKASARGQFWTAEKTIKVLKRDVGALKRGDKE